MLTILLSQQASTNLSAIDWSTLIVGILSFVGIIITLLVNNSQNKKLEKIEKESFEDEFSRNLITNSRNEWLKNFKEDLSKFLACMMNYSDIAWHEKVDDKLLAAKLGDDANNADKDEIEEETAQQIAKNFGIDLKQVLEIVK